MCTPGRDTSTSQTSTGNSESPERRKRMRWTKHCICPHPIICFLPLSFSDTQLSVFSAAHLFLGQEQVETPALGSFSCGEQPVRTSRGWGHQGLGLGKGKEEVLPSIMVALHQPQICMISEPGMLPVAAGPLSSLPRQISCELCEPPFWSEHHSSLL